MSDPGFEQPPLGAPDDPHTGDPQTEDPSTPPPGDPGVSARSAQAAGVDDTATENAPA